MKRKRQKTDREGSPGDEAPGTAPLGGDSRFVLSGALWDMARRDAPKDGPTSQDDRGDSSSGGGDDDDGGAASASAAGSKSGKKEAKSEGSTTSTAPSKPSKPTKGPLSLKHLKKFKKKHDKTGVIYLSSIPPFMRVQKLRSLLSQYGEVLRIYLAPEDQAITRKRKKYRGNRRVKHTDGWVEFARKSVAKRVALALNNTPIGGKKRDYYSQDIWNMRYLSKFKWHHLTERIAYQSNVREQRIRNDMVDAKRLTKFYLHKANQSKALQAIQTRRRREKRGSPDGADGASHGIHRTFRQREALRKGVAPQPPE